MGKNKHSPKTKQNFKQLGNDGFPVFVKAKPKQTGFKIKPKKNRKTGKPPKPNLNPNNYH